MRKFILLISTLIIAISDVNAQTFEVNDGSVGGIISNNSVISQTIAALGVSLLDINIKNTSATSKTFGISRVDNVINAGTGAGARAYFCFGGQCFGSNVTTAPPANYVTVGSGSTSVNQQLYFEEDDLTEGYSEITYKVYDVNNISDFITFKFKFNPLLASIKNNAVLFSSVSEVYPNPTVTKSQITINSKVNISNATLNITNALGSIIQSKTIELSVGKNAVILDSENLSSGIYFATISSDRTRVVKKFTVNK